MDTMTPTTAPQAQPFDERHRQTFGLQKAASVLRVSKSTLRRMIAKGQIRAIRLSERIIRVSQVEIDRVLQIHSES